MLAMAATVEGDVIRVKFPYSPEWVNAIKGIEGRWFHPDTKSWTVPKSQYPALVRALPIKIEELEDWTPPEPPAALADLIRSNPAPRKLGSYDLMRHQIIGSDLILEGNIGLFFDTGTGKTPTVLDAVSRMMPLRCLVVCPLALIRGAWEVDVRKFLGDGFPFLDLHGIAKAKRWKALQRHEAGIAAINFESFKSSFEDLVKWRADLLVIDESAKAKDPRSQITKALLKYAEGVGIRVVLLSGTPAPNSKLEYYPQLRILGAKVPRSFLAFRNMIATPQKLKINASVNGNYIEVRFEFNKEVIGFIKSLSGSWYNMENKSWFVPLRHYGALASALSINLPQLGEPKAAGHGPGKMDPVGLKWELTPGGEKVLLGMLVSCSWHVSKEDVLDLPERTFIVRPIELSPKERDTYEQMKKHKIAEILQQTGRIDTVVAPMVLTQLAKLRQMTSGFTYVDGATVTVGRSKLDALLELLEEIGPHPVVLWAHYRAEFAALRKALLQLDGGIVEYHGGVAEEAKHEALEAFRAGRARCLLASPASIGHGVTLTNASYMVWFSGSYSYEQFHQANDRIYRYGQKNACTYYHLAARDTIDEVLLSVVNDKAAVSQAVLKFLKGDAPCSRTAA